MFITCILGLPYAVRIDCASALIDSALGRSTSGTWVILSAVKYES